MANGARCVRVLKVGLFLYEPPLSTFDFWIHERKAHPGYRDGLQGSHGLGRY